MRVEIKLSAEAAEPFAVIYTRFLTEEVRTAASLIEGVQQSRPIPVSDDEKIFVLRPEEIYLVRVENERVAVYTRASRYESGKRLYEFEAALGGGFMCISKSTLINLDQLDCAAPTLGGLMQLVLKNGQKDVISRRYLPAFKNTLAYRRILFMKTLMKKISSGVVMDCFAFVAILFIASLAAGGANAFFEGRSGEELLRMAACFVGIAVGFYVPTLVYANERLALWLRALIHFTAGTVAFLLVSCFAGWIQANLGSVALYAAMALAFAAACWGLHAAF